MKRIIKNFIVNTVTIYLISQVVSGMTFANGITTLLLTGAVLSVSQAIVKPLINLLLLPINLITFGLFKWVSYAITLYIVTLVVPGFDIANFYYAGINTYWLSVPTINFPGVLGLIAFSFVISLISSIISWLMK